MQERLCINLVHLNIQVSVPRPLAVMQQVWNTYQRTSCSPPPPPHHPSPLQSNLPERGKTAHSSHSQLGGRIQNPVLSETAHKHFDNKNTHTHTQATKLSHPRAFRKQKTLHECSLIQQLTAEWEIYRGKNRDSGVLNIFIFFCHAYVSGPSGKNCPCEPQNLF